jgi:hypothetical protein
MTQLKSLEYTSVALSLDEEEEESSDEDARQRRRVLHSHKNGGFAWIFILVLVLTATAIVSCWHFIARNSGRSISGPDTTSMQNQAEKQDSSTKATSAADTQQPETSCHTEFECQTDRISHNRPLYVGQAICATKYPYAVGLAAEGILQWTNCDSGETHVIARASKNPSGTTRNGMYYFMLLDDASWNLYDETSGQLLWKKECLKPVKLYPHCLSHPDLNCPYLHLHNDGVIVLNWIDEDGVWIARDARRPNIYQQFFEE